LAAVKNNTYLTVNLGTYRKLIQRLEPMEMRVESDKLMVWRQDPDTLDQVLYTLNGSMVNKMVDIVKVNNTLSSENNTFIDISYISFRMAINYF
jgi:hypothetical protein